MRQLKEITIFKENDPWLGCFQSTESLPHVHVHAVYMIVDIHNHVMMHYILQYLTFTKQLMVYKRLGVARRGNKHNLIVVVISLMLLS